MAAPVSKHAARVSTIWSVFRRQCSVQSQPIKSSKSRSKAKAQAAPSAPSTPEPLPHDFTRTFTISGETGTPIPGTNRAKAYLNGKLREAVTPLWQVPYDKQLELKQLRCHGVLMRLTNALIEQEASVGVTATLDRARNSGRLCCQLGRIKPSPLTEGYRNKSEFNVGVGADGSRKTVGLFIGEWKKKNVLCLPSDPARNISQAHKNVEKAYQKFLRQSPLDVSLSFEDSGNWKGMTVRSNQEGDVMAIISFVQNDLSETETEDAMLSLQDFFAYAEGKECGLSSLYFQSSFRATGVSQDPAYHLLLGKPHLQETLFDLQFRISPSAFFQVNTPATEVLYTVVAELCSLSPDSTVLDLCSGTGTIGLVLADRVREVVGVEVVQQAVEDARVNAEHNAISNATFVCGPVEEVLPDILPTLEGAGDLIVVANPARAGLHPRVVKIIRNSPSIRRLVYVCCKPEGSAAKNFIDLCCPPTTRLHGKPFTPVKAVPVDLFPDTYHCELVLLFER